jgi:transcriptional regulator with XRE-family HTH domain
MDITPAPVLRRRQAGLRLRQLREAAGASLAEVASYLDCSLAKISRIETGRMAARLPDVRSMLDLYRSSETDRKELLALVRDSRQRGWWREYADVLPDGIQTFLGLQDAAHTIEWFDPVLIPGLLQTRDYAHALHAPRVEVPDQRVDRLIEVRMASQRLLDRPDPPNLHAVIDEAALRRGASDPAVMRDQVLHLRRLARRPNVTIQVIPFTAGFLPSPVGFTMLGMPDPNRPGVVFFEQMWGTQSESRPELLGRFRLAFDRLRCGALDAERTEEFLARIARELDARRGEEGRDGGRPAAD